MFLLIFEYGCFVWLKQHLHSETESIIIAIQNQVIATRVIESKVMHKPVPSLMCRMCHQAEETIVHLLSACPQLVSTAYLHRHNLIAMVVHWYLMKVYSFPTVSQSWCSHRPPPVLESSVAKILVYILFLIIVVIVLILCCLTIRGSKFIL